MTTQSFIRGGLKLPALLSILLLPQAMEAKNIPGVPPYHCDCCASSISCPTCTTQSDTSSGLSLSEGDLTEQVPVSSTQSSSGPTVNVSAVYNS